MLLLFFISLSAVIYQLGILSLVCFASISIILSVRKNEVILRKSGWKPSWDERVQVTMLNAMGN